MTNRQKRAAELAQGMELCIYEFLGKAAEDEDVEIVQEALCRLSVRIITGWNDISVYRN